MKQYIMGLSCFYHDSAAVLLDNGKIVSAVQEERFSRIKQDKRFPIHAIKYCLSSKKIHLTNIDHIYYYENPSIKFNRIVSTYLNFGFKGFSNFVTDIPNWLLNKLYVKSIIKNELIAAGFDPKDIPPISYIPHHQSHAASAFYPSPFKEAAVLCIDGVGEWVTTSAWLGKDNSLKPLWEIRFPHSLGLLYSAFTYFCGFKVDSGEYKLMGLAPYGKPTYYEKIVNDIIEINEDGSFWLNMDYFDYAVGDCIISNKFSELFDGPPRKSESLITQREFDLAASIQAVLEQVVFLIAKNLKEQTGQKNLCLSGGVALNCVSNGKLAESGLFDSIWIQPAAGDAGGALGAAYEGWYSQNNNLRTTFGCDQMQGSYLGTEYSSQEYIASLIELNAQFEQVSDDLLTSTVSELLTQGHVIGWFQGRMEFGPRSLGSRSIIGDPRDPKMQSRMNLKIKNRESFRPFAPAILAEHASDWFEVGRESPYMLFVHSIKGNHRIHETEADQNKQGIEKLQVVRSTIPAITHVDFSARVQTVHQETNPLFHQLIQSFYELTGCPVLVNTSFNVRGEPIVESVKDAYTCFMRTEMDYLIIGNCILAKKDQPQWNEQVNWQMEFSLD
ncbi:MAG: carbamoyltransferase [Legionella sp.]|uniref:carbamoyltransferase family protein n=1 Tax=Legionella sp. TaxID=459 RepID=UPI0039E622AF